MLSWQIGDARVSCLHETVLELPIDSFIEGVDHERLAPHLPWLQPSFVAPNGDLRVAIQAVLVESQGTKVVVDTCIGNDRVIPNLPVFQTDFLERLEAAGFGPDQVDLVLCTHLHLDHVGWNTRLEGDRWVPTFPRATYLFGAEEYEFWQANRHDNVELTDTVAPIVEAGLHRLVATDHRITDEVRLRPTPGHTPGHVSVVVESGGARAVISGDVIHNPLQLVDGSWCAYPDWDKDEARRTRAALVDELTGTSTLLVGTHFPDPSGGYVVRTAEGDVRLAPQPAEAAAARP